MHEEKKKKKEHREWLGFKIIREEHIILDFMPWLICYKKNQYPGNVVDFEFIERVINW